MRALRPDAGGRRLAAVRGLGAAHGAGGARPADAGLAVAGAGLLVCAGRQAHVVAHVAAAGGGGVLGSRLGLRLVRLAAQQPAVGGAGHAGADLEDVLAVLGHARGACRVGREQGWVDGQAGSGGSGDNSGAGGGRNTIRSPCAILRQSIHTIRCQRPDIAEGRAQVAHSPAGHACSTPPLQKNCLSAHA